MTNRFAHITSQRKKSASLTQQVSQCETQLKGKPAVKRIGRDNFDTLMSLLAEEPETSTTPLGVFVANSTKRKLRMQIGELFQP